jgi:hypothetical protein
MFTLIETAKLNGVDPQAWLADVLAHIADHNGQRLDQLHALEVEGTTPTRRLTHVSTPHPAHPAAFSGYLRLPRRCADDLAGCQARSSEAARSRRSIDPAEDMLAHAKWQTISWHT